MQKFLPVMFLIIVSDDNFLVAKFVLLQHIFGNDDHLSL